jgi:hypothetical protein
VSFVATVNTESSKTRRCWGVWVTSPHIGYHLAIACSSSAEARRYGKARLRNGSADEVTIRRIDLARPVILHGGGK